MHSADSECESRVHAMNQAMAHRGPDADGVWSDQLVCLGHRRLSIIDTSAAGNQPFHSADGKYVLVFNGEIYNYLELRAELSAQHQFTTLTDTEVLLAAYAHWGIQMTERLFGMFAFVLYDRQTGEIHVVRDRMGVKPLYYYKSTKGFVFASEIRSLLASDLVPKKLDQTSLAEYFSYQTVHAPRTILENVMMLEAGHRLHFSGGAMESVCYWDPKNPPLAAVEDMDRDNICAEVKKRMVDAVSMRMRADVPFGAFLSGGIDSSAIVGLMASQTAQQVKTFSVTFDEKEWDESNYSNLIAKKFNTDHCEIRLSASHFMQQVPAAIEAMDHPSGDGPNTYVVSQVTRQAGVKMALSGIGGDELFAGYDVFKRLYRMEGADWARWIPRILRQAIGQSYSKLRPSVAAEKIAETLQTPGLRWHEVYPLVRAIYTKVQVSKFFRNAIPSIDFLAKDCQSMESIQLPLLSKISLAESNSYLQNVLLRDSDQMSMAHALEVREPFLDHRLIEFVLAVGDQDKYPHYPKQLFVDAMGDLLPPEIVHRPKMGFTFPWATWMRNELRPYCEEGIQELKKVEALEPIALEEAWQGFLKNHPHYTWSRLWPMVVLGQWIRINGISCS
jgi:asparagine synthase (glutamine-hydrolysing)